ncbi:MAG: hypothetical protein ABIH85_02175 [Candidatus Omnitrophota bacterium]|nr:hypothetical protein [Candidatus Omnitrophota bacterium]
MKKIEFFEELKKVLEIEGEIDENTNLKDLETYDSLSNLVLIAFVDSKFKKRMGAEEVVSITTIKSLMEIIGLENFE